jgi:lipopolysaccharide biosynthesis glycosyltransferase
MPNCCICFTVDAGYLLPTLVSAIKARDHSSRNLADVAIFMVGPASQDVTEFTKTCSRENIGFYPARDRLADAGHTAYSRLFLSRIAPEIYDQFLYVDGDTQTVGSLDPLISLEVPRGRFMAASDPLAFEFGHGENLPPRLQEYFGHLGGARIRETFFNSGVMRINRAGWDEIGQEALKFCRRLPPGASRFWDQDGLNAVAANARIAMSLKWNFPIFMRNCRVEEQISPIVYHFMSAPKPWNGAFPPWDRSCTRPYRDLISKYPALRNLNPSFTFPKTAKYWLQQRIKKLHETVTWGQSSRRERILSYEESIKLASSELIPNNEAYSGASTR